MTPKQLERFRRRERVLELFELDISVRQIADHLNRELEAKGEKPVTFQTVHNDLIWILDYHREEFRLKTRHHVQVAINQLKRISQTHMTKMLQASTPDQFEKMSRGFERIWRRHDALLGLHKPQKIEMSTRESLAKLLGRDPEELPDGDPDS